MEIELFSDNYYMREALKQAQMAFDEGEIPVGAVVVSNQKIIARAHNLTQRLNDVTAHAEMQAITAAANYLGSKYLHNCSIYITLEPCSMCAGALFWSQVSRIVIGAADPKSGFSAKGGVLHPKTEYSTGVMEVESAELMTSFFLSKRKK